MSKKMILMSLMVAASASSICTSAVNAEEVKQSTATAIEQIGDQQVAATSGFTWWWE
jgi:hypothetical protein